MSTTWYKSTYDKSKFKLNNKRKKDLLGVIENFEESDSECAVDDAEDVRCIIKMLENNEINAAIKFYRNLDTAVRDEFPQWFWELSGGEVNPIYFDPKATLEATEK